MRLLEQAMKFHVSIIAAVCGLTFVPALAYAQDQPWLKDRRYTEGIGYRVGDFELHPGLAGEFGYDSNFYHRSDQDFGGDVGALRIRITPSFSFSTLSPQRREVTPGASPPDVTFRGGVSATYNEFIGVSGPAGDTGKDGISKQRNVGVEADTQLGILPGRPVSGDLYANFVRTITPTQVGVIATPSGVQANTFNRDSPRVGGEFIVAPGGGLLDMRLGYDFSATVFEDSLYTSLTSLQHQISLRGRWRFLPRTALIFDGTQGFISYPNGGFKTDSHPLRTQLGVNGLITNSFALLAEAGWGASFYKPTGQEDFDSVIGRLELKWFITPNPSTDPQAATLALSSVAVGFQRDFADSYIGTFFEQDKGYAKLSYFFGGAFLVVLDGDVGPVRYPNITAPVQITSFTDVRADASLFGEYRIKDSFGINATLRYGGNFSKTEITFSDGSSQHLDWQEFEAYIGARWFM